MTVSNLQVVTTKIWNNWRCKSCKKMAIKLKQLDTTVTCADSRNTVDKRCYVLCRQFWQNQTNLLTKKIRIILLIRCVRLGLASKEAPLKWRHEKKERRRWWINWLIRLTSSFQSVFGAKTVRVVNIWWGTLWYLSMDTEAWYFFCWC